MLTFATYRCQFHTSLTWSKYQEHYLGLSCCKRVCFNVFNTVTARWKTNIRPHFPHSPFNQFAQQTQHLLYSHYAVGELRQLCLLETNGPRDLVVFDFRLHFGMQGEKTNQANKLFMTMENSDKVLLKACTSIWVPRRRAKEANKYGKEQNYIKVAMVTAQACPCKTVPGDQQPKCYVVIKQPQGALYQQLECHSTWQEANKCEYQLGNLRFKVAKLPSNASNCEVSGRNLIRARSRTSAQ